MKAIAVPCQPAAIACALLFSCIAAPAHAADPAYSVEGGWSFMGDEHFTADQGAAAAFGEAMFDDHGIGSTNITWSPDVTAGWISGRGDPPRVYHGYSTRDDIWMVAVGLRFHFGAADAWYRPFFASVQPTLHTGRTPALSGCYEFTITFGWQFAHWMIGVRHISNADTHLPNLGESMLVGGVSF
jgi:hypothetical protein